MEKIQAVIFDLYNTLIYLADDTKPHKGLFTAIGLQTPEELSQAYQIATTEAFDNLADLIKRIKPSAQINLEPYQKEIEKERASATLYPETINVLNELKKRNLPLGLISNLASPYKKPFFDLGLNEYFNEILFSCDAGLKKPNLKIYQEMIKKLKVEPAQALMTGDNVKNDVEGPKSIGINAVHLDRTNTTTKSISSLEGIFLYF